MKKRTSIAKAGVPFKKPLLIMRLIILLVVFSTFHATAGLNAQKISVKANSAEISKVLNDIQKQGDYRFVYNNSLRDLKQRVTISFDNLDLQEAMARLFAGTSLTYVQLENNLVAIRSTSPDEKDIRVTGKVTNETGEPISAASVMVKGTAAGTITDGSGNFAITVSENAVLVISAVGYNTVEVSVAGKQQLTIKLEQATKKMDEVVVVGYGVQRKIDVTGSVAQVKGEEISKQASVNPMSAIQGKVAGVQITNSGAPGSSPQIRIRGVGSIYGSKNPLYVVDGVWYDDISFLNPADIENMSILKDASSESIYGIRAANGVVLITTKKGRSGQAVINYNGFWGWQKVTNQVEMSNANEYATLVNELSVMNGGTAFLNAASFSKGTDWYHQVLRNAYIGNHQLSISGGNEKSNYNFSLGALNQNGIVETNKYERYTIRLQNDFRVTNFLRMGYTASGYYSKSNDIDGGIFRQLFAAGPVVPVRYADGTYGDPNDFNLGGGNNFNPQTTIDFFNQVSKNYRLNGSAFAELKFARFFTFKTSVGGEFGEGEVRNYVPVYTATVAQRNNISKFTGSRAETRNWILENTLTFDKTIGADHSLKVMVGQAAQRYKSYGFTGTISDVPNGGEGNLYFILGDPATGRITDYGDLTTIASYFGRINYAFQSKYLITASVRADGSSKFYGDNRWGYFPSVGAGWVISKEKFMQNQKVFDNLKLRGSWGIIGNASVPSNISVLTVTQFPLAVWGDGSTGVSNSIASVVPPTTYWEKGVGTDIAVEASFLNSRLFVEADYYNRKTENAIFDIPILGTLGSNSGSIIGNSATFQNKGFEFSLTWKDNPSKDFNYSVNANMSVNENKVLSAVTGPVPIYSGGGGLTGGALATRTIVGLPIGHFYGYQVAGIFQNAAEIASSAQTSAKPGDFKYVDQNKDGVISGLDRIVLGNPNPKYTYGINTLFGYKQFDLAVDFQGVAGVQVYNANLGWRYGNENFTKDFYNNRWHGEGTSTTYPSVGIGGGTNYLPNSFYVENGSYFRIRNMQLGYTLPENMAKKIFAKKLRVYANAQNAFTFFKYKGFSPEIRAENNSPLNAGIDANVYPLSATYNFGVNVTF